jgi:hypothetical protein
LEAKKYQASDVTETILWFQDICPTVQILPKLELILGLKFDDGQSFRGCCHGSVRLTMDKEKRICLPLLSCAARYEMFCSTFNGSNWRVGRFSAFGDDSARLGKKAFNS